MAEKGVKTSEISEIHAKIIDEWLNNGHNKTQAVLKHSGKKIHYRSGINMFDTIQARPEVKAYIQAKQEQRRREADIKGLDILMTLKNWLHADPTQFIGLTPDEIKELPANIRQCIQDVDYKEKTYTNRQGHEVTERHCKIKLVSKADTIEKINKHLGFYAEDNRQKGVNINALIQNFTKDNPQGAMQLLEALETGKEQEQ